MKKQLITLALICLSVGSVLSQSYIENFLGEDFMQYKGASFKLKDNAVSGLNYTFYGDFQHCQKPYDKNVLYPDVKFSFITIMDSLANREFIVEDIVGKDGKLFSGGSFLEKPIFVLKDKISNHVIYFLYDQKYEHNFPFLTSPITMDTTTLCAKIQNKTDDFTDEITINSPPLESNQIAPMIIYKIVKSGKENYYLSLRTYGSTVNVGETGVIVLFDDGTKMNKPTEKIDVDSDATGFSYSAFIQLTETEVKSLTTKKITKFRLYIYDKEVSQGFAEKFTNYVQCVIGKQ